MVSTQNSYARRISPPKYRRQTLEVFDVYRNSKSEHLAHLPPRPVSALDRKWVHRSLGDLTSDTDLINSHPRLQTDFYQELYRKYPQAFTRRRNAREAGRRLFNSRPHVRFEDEEHVRSLEQRSRSAMDLYNRHDGHMTNWDREVGPYIRKNSRECFTSVEPSECSGGSVLSLKQRLHLNSVTLNNLLNQKSPLRKKFERDRMAYDSGTENEQTLEDYFLDKSRQRSRNRVKHRKVLQHRINNTNNANTRTNGHEQNSSHRQWMSKSVSPVSRNMYSLPRQNSEPVQNSESEKRQINYQVNSLDMEDVMRNTDLKIDTLLDKMGSRFSGPESPPDSAIDIDTPSVQSLVSNDKVMSSDNVYHVNIDLSADGDSNDNHLTGNASYERNPTNSEHFQNMQESRDSLSEELSAIVRNSAMNMDHSISHESQIMVSELPEDSIDQNIRDFNHQNRKISSSQGPGLLQLYTAELMPELSRMDNRFNLMYENDQRNDEISNTAAEQIDIAGDIATMPDSCQPKPTTSEIKNNANSNRRLDYGFTTEQDFKDKSAPTSPTRGRHKTRDITQTSSLQSGQIIVPDRSDVDTSILDEVQLDGMSHDLIGRRPSDNVDDTDVRLGIPKVTSHEAKIAEKYRRTRSPSPFIVRYRRNNPVDRPKSAPLLGAEALDIRIVDIPLTNSNSSETMESNTQDKHSADKTCQRDDILKANTNDISNSDRNEDYDSDLHNISNNGASKPLHDNANSATKIHVQNSDSKALIQVNTNSAREKHVQNSESKILVSSSQVKQRNSQIMPKDSEVASEKDEDILVHEMNHYGGSNGNYTNDVVKDDLNSVRESTNPSRSYNGHGGLENENLRSETISSKRGVYKPSGASSRTKENKIRLKSLLKSKRGSYSPAPLGMPIEDEQAGIQNNMQFKGQGVLTQDVHNDIDDIHELDNMPVRNEKVQYLNGEMDDVSMGQGNTDESAYGSHMHFHQYGTNPSIQSDRTSMRESPVSSGTVEYDSDEDDPDNEDSTNRTEHKADIHAHINAKAVPNTYSEDNVEDLVDSDTESDPQTVKSKTVNDHYVGDNYANDNDYDNGHNDHTQGRKHGEQTDKVPVGFNGNFDTYQQDKILQGSTDNIGATGKDIVLPKFDKDSGSSQESLPRNTNIPPAKPARTKHKKLPTDLDMAQYKIMPQNQTEVPHHRSTSQSGSLNDDRTGHSDNVKPVHLPHDEIDVMGPQTSNLAQSKAMSASKGSLLGGFKSATKGKLKSLRKAMSLEKGMEKAGVMTFPDPNNPANPGADNAGFTKMKKAPSLKSITSLFSRKKKKKGKLNSEETESSSAYGSCQSISSAHTGSSDSHQPVIMQQKQGTSTNKPGGKLQKINPDGTQLIQLVKPQTGPIGFFIAKGSAKYKNGIFISRFADSQPEKTFSGLLSVGDEILEVNGNFVRDLSQDDVYNIISASPIIVMKIFPFIARKDV